MTVLALTGARILTPDGWLDDHAVVVEQGAGAAIQAQEIGHERAGWSPKKFGPGAALGDVARARGMTQLARDTGLSRESLYKSRSGERAPSSDTLFKVIRAMGFKLSLQAQG